MNVSNIMTSSRIVFGPLFIVCFLSFGWVGKVFALLLAVLIELTDALDGVVARRRGEVSDLGRYLDPFADSISRVSVFLAFFAHDPPLAGVWMLAIIFYRDMMVAYIRIWSMRHGVVQAARASGKIKAIVQGVAIVAICAGALADAGQWFPNVPIARISWWIMVAVTAVTAVSGIEYALGLRHLGRNKDTRRQA